VSAAVGTVRPSPSPGATTLRSRWARRLRFYVPAVVVFVATLVVWEILATVMAARVTVLPAPSVIVQTLQENWSSARYPLGAAVQATLFEALGGLVIGTVGGVIVALISSRFLTARDVLLPVAVAAGIAALDMAAVTSPYGPLEARAIQLADGLAEGFRAAGIPATANRAWTMFSVFFMGGPVRDFAGAKAADHERYARLFHHLLERGVALPPSGYELWTLGTAHGRTEVDLILEAASTFPG